MKKYIDIFCKWPYNVTATKIEFSLVSLKRFIEIVTSLNKSFPTFY